MQNLPSPDSVEAPHAEPAAVLRRSSKAARKCTGQILHVQRLCASTRVLKRSRRRVTLRVLINPPRVDPPGLVARPQF
jgi:hypothetical protein